MKKLALEGVRDHPCFFLLCWDRTVLGFGGGFWNVSYFSSLKTRNSKPFQVVMGASLA